VLVLEAHATVFQTGMLYSAVRTFSLSVPWLLPGHRWNSEPSEGAEGRISEVEEGVELGVNRSIIVISQVFHDVSLLLTRGSSSRAGSEGQATFGEIEPKRVQRKERTAESMASVLI